MSINNFSRSPPSYIFNPNNPISNATQDSEPTTPPVLLPLSEIFPSKSCTSFVLKLDFQSTRILRVTFAETTRPFQLFARPFDLPTESSKDMTQDVVQRSLSGLKEHHVHIINKDASVFGWLKQALPHEAKPKKPDLAKLFVHPISHPEGKSGSSSAASSLKSGKNKDLERKYGIVKSLVGEGGSSVVWMTRVKSSETVYALKSYRVKSDDKRRDFEENIVAEFKILSALDNPFIIKTFELLQGTFPVQDSTSQADY